MREGEGNCVKYLKRGETEKSGGERKILRRGGKLGQGVGALKKVEGAGGGGGWNPHTNCG